MRCRRSCRTRRRSLTRHGRQTSRGRSCSRCSSPPSQPRQRSPSAVGSRRGGEQPLGVRRGEHRTNHAVRMDESGAVFSSGAASGRFPEPWLYAHLRARRGHRVRRSRRAGNGPLGSVQHRAGPAAGDRRHRRRAGAGVAGARDGLLPCLDGRRKSACLRSAERRRGREAGREHGLGGRGIGRDGPDERRCSVAPSSELGAASRCASKASSLRPAPASTRGTARQAVGVGRTSFGRLEHPPCDPRRARREASARNGARRRLCLADPQPRTHATSPAAVAGSPRGSGRQRRGRWGRDPGAGRCRPCGRAVLRRLPASVSSASAIGLPEAGTTCTSPLAPRLTFLSGPCPRRSATTRALS